MRTGAIAAAVVLLGLACGKSEPAAESDDTPKPATEAPKPKVAPVAPVDASAPASPPSPAIEVLLDSMPGPFVAVGRGLAFFNTNHKLVTVDLRTKKEINEQPLTPDAVQAALKRTGNDHYWATTVETPSVALGPSGVLVEDKEKLTWTPKGGTPVVLDRGNIWHPLISPDGKYAAWMGGTAKHQGGMKVARLEGRLPQIQVHKPKMSLLTWSADSQAVFATQNLTHCAGRVPISGAPFEKIHCEAAEHFVLAGELLIVADAAISWHRVADGEELRRVEVDRGEDPQERSSRIIASPAGTVLFSVSDTPADDGRMELHTPGGDRVVLADEFCRSGRWLDDTRLLGECAGGLVVVDTAAVLARSAKKSKSSK